MPAVQTFVTGGKRKGLPSLRRTPASTLSRKGRASSCDSAARLHLRFQRSSMPVLGAIEAAPMKIFSLDQTLPRGGSSHERKGCSLNPNVPLVAHKALCERPPLCVVEVSRNQIEDRRHYLHDLQRRFRGVGPLACDVAIRTIDAQRRRVHAHRQSEPVATSTSLEGRRVSGRDRFPFAAR